MITKEQIDHYIDQVPPKPEALKQTVAFLKKGELSQAAKAASQDKAMSAYLHNLINKPIFGFRKEVTDISQIFGILGLTGSQQAVYNYLVNLLSPNKWSLFKLNKQSFHDLQAELSSAWKKILIHLKIDDQEIESAISLLPASIIVADALFATKLNDVKLLKGSNDIDYNTILKRMSDKDLFDICEAISQKWNMDPNIASIIQGASGVKEITDQNSLLLAKWMHMLLFFALSKPEFISADLNSFIDFQVEFVQDIYLDFTSIMELES